MTYGLNDWTTAEEETLKRMTIEGYSASLIAQQLSNKSRAAVIGKRARMGLRSLHPRGGIRMARQSRAKLRNNGATIASLKSRYKAGHKLPPFEELREIQIECRKVDFFDLREHHCRYPINEKGEYGIAKFCGCEVWDKSSYCLDHTRLAYECR